MRARGASVALRSIKAATPHARTAYLVSASRIGSKALRGGAKVATTGTVLYMAVHHSELINDILAGIAELLDVPAWLVQHVGWIVLLTPLLYLLSLVSRLFVKPAIWVLTHMVAALTTLQQKSKLQAVQNIPQPLRTPLRKLPFGARMSIHLNFSADVFSTAAKRMTRIN